MMMMSLQNVCFRTILFSSTVLLLLTTGAKALAIRKVAIVGGGIAGLTTAHCLEQKGIPYDIFDARPGIEVDKGAGVQLNGGLSLLGKINPSLRDAVYEAGLPLEAIRSTCKSWFSSDETSTSFDTLFQLNLPSLIRDSGSEEIVSSLTEDSSNNNRVWWVSIMRSTLQETLASALPRPVQFSKRLVRLEDSTGDEVGLSNCVFEDGSTSGPYDIIIGCEGINSLVKNTIMNDGKVPDDSSSSSSKKIALYSGIRMRYAVADCDENDSTTTTAATFTQHLGDGVYALDSVYGAGKGKPKKRCAFLVYLDPTWSPFSPRDTGDVDEENKSRAGENVDWNQEKQLAAENVRSAMQNQLVESGISDPVVRSTIDASEQFFELGSYFHSPFGSWSSRRRDKQQAHLVLCGDSAHALPPFLGQGANQAVQDAYCLVNQLAIFNEQTDDALSLQDHLDIYESTRWPCTFSILAKSIFLGYLETGGPDGVASKFRDVLFRILYIIGVVPKILLGAAVPRV